MKNKIIFLTLAAFSVAATSYAQKGLTKLDIGYNIALPQGSFKDIVGNTSYRGFEAAVLYGLNDRFSLGVGTGFQDFYQKNPRQVYKLSDGSDISAVLTHSVQTIPLLAQMKYSFTPGAVVQPYAALGIGGNLISYSQLFGEFGDQQTKFGFAARPELGLAIPFKKGGESGFRLGASYNIMPFKEIGFTNLNSIGVHAGVTIPLRK
jgi:opacity protein-like surface antigen